MLFIFAALFSLFYATIACAEEFTALNLVPLEKYWFAVPPPQVDVRAYGISFALSSDKCTWSDPIDFTLYQIDKQTKEKYEVSEVFKTRIYPRDIDKFRFYNVFFVKDLDEVDSGPQKIFLDVAKGKQCLMTLTTSAPMRFHFQGAICKAGVKIEGPAGLFPGETRGNVELYTNGLIRLISDPFGSAHTGVPISGLESPPGILAFLASIALVCLVVILILFIVPGQAVFSEQWRQLAILVVGTSSVIFILYFITAAPEFLSGDTNEMQVSWYLYQDVHFPGYPLGLLLGHLYQKIFPFGNFMYKANLFAATCSAIGVGFFAGAIYLLTKHKTSAVLISLVMATTQTIWNYSVVAQNYSVSILFQCLLLFAIVNLQKHPTYPSFFKVIIFAFLAPIAHMTNAPGAIVIILTATVWYWRTHRFQLFKITKIILSLGLIVVILYSPLLLMKSPRNYPPVISKSSDHNLLTFNKNNFYTFLNFITGDNSPHKEKIPRRSGIINTVKTQGIFVILRNQSLRYLKLLGFGYGYLFAVMGGMGLVFLLIYKKKELITWYLAFTLIGNYIFNCSELAFYSSCPGGLHPEDYVLTTHQIPSIIILSFAMVGVILFITMKRGCVDSKGSVEKGKYA
jgi:hypothetical protein